MTAQATRQTYESLRKLTYAAENFSYVIGKFTNSICYSIRLKTNTSICVFINVGRLRRIRMLVVLVPISFHISEPLVNGGYKCNFFSTAMTRSTQCSVHKDRLSYFWLQILREYFSLEQSWRFS